MRKANDDFIRVTTVKNNPGNDKQISYIRVSSILDFAEALPEYAKIGGASTINTRFGVLVCVESMDDIFELLSRIQVPE